MRRAISIAFSALLTLHSAHAGLPEANETLLHSAHSWEAHDRGDLAILALQKLVAARPDLPEALQELGELALRMGNVDIATGALDQLNTRFAGSAHTKSYALTYRLLTRDRLQLASLDRLIQMSNYQQARAEFSRLFPDGAPDGYLGIEYYSLMARIPGNWQRVLDGLQKLAARHPDDARYQFALAKHLLRDDDNAMQGIRLLQELTQRDDVRNSEVDDEISRALQDLGPNNAPIAILQDYLRRHGDDKRAQALFAQIKTRQLAEQRWWRDALLLIEPDASVSGDAQTQERLNTLRNRNEKLGDALQAWYVLDRDTGTPRNASADIVTQQWREQAKAALAQHDYAHAHLDFRIALALKQGNYEDTIALSDELIAANRDAEAGNLLATASSLASTSSWLFETQVRWLIRHQRFNEALGLLDKRATDKKYLPATRDALRADALQERAAQTIKTQPQQALQDLQTALALAPDNVWLRYRLATALADQGQAERGTAIMQAGADRLPTNVDMCYAQALYLSGIQHDDAALQAIQAVPAAQRTADMQALAERLQHAQLRRHIDALIAQERLAEAAAQLDALIAATPDSRGLRIWRAELDQRMNHPEAARDRLAQLVAEQPDDLDTRLDYVRALTNSGDLALARVQLQGVVAVAPQDDAALQMSIARRGWTLDEIIITNNAVDQVLAQQPGNAEAQLLKARVLLAQHRPADARTHLLLAEQQPSSSANDARALREALDARLQASLTSALINRHKPGDDGISKFDSTTWTNAFVKPLDYERQLTLHADALSLDAGDLPDSFKHSDIGTGYLHPNDMPSYQSNTQRGVALGAIYHSEQFTADIGTTPLGFLLTNIVGGAAWQPQFKQLDLSLGIERRALTSSVLSYAGMRDPFTGEKWGGVMSTGPYVQAGLYREQYSLSGALRAAAISGTQVQSNRQFSARLSGNRRWLTWINNELWAGLSLNYWNYQHNLENYTFGSGGYYSPQSYISLALPVEWQGKYQQWSYQLRASIAYSSNRTDQSDFFPLHTNLQQQAATQASINGDAAPVFTSSTGSGVSFAALARVERQLTSSLVLGGQFSMDRSDYYHPVELGVYLRRGFGGKTSIAIPPRGLRPYND